MQKVLSYNENISIFQLPKYHLTNSVLYSISLTNLDVLPTFEWNLDGSLTVDFNDGGLPDVANLQRIHSQFGNDDDDDSNNECMLTGFLSDESTVAVRVLGCPGQDSFQVTQRKFTLPNCIIR